MLFRRTSLRVKPDAVGRTPFRRGTLAIALLALLAGGSSAEPERTPRFADDGSIPAVPTLQRASAVADPSSRMVPAAQGNDGAVAPDEAGVLQRGDPVKAGGEERTQGIPDAPGEPCDGYDNDGDGIVDEGCDQTCDQPENLGPGTRVTTLYGHSGRPSLVWTGSEYGLAWEDVRLGIYWRALFARLDASGAQIGPTHFITATDQSMIPSLTFADSRYGVAWLDNRDGHGGVYFTRIDATGEPMGPEVDVPGYAPFQPSLVWTGSEYGLATSDSHPQYGGIYFSRLDAEGVLVASMVQVVHSYGVAYRDPSLVWDDNGYGLAWTDSRHGAYEVFFTRLNSLGSDIGPDLRVTTAGVDSYVPELAWTGTEYGLAWQDHRDGKAQIYFARISAAGAKIGSDLRITDGASDSHVPSLVWNGSEYGLAWHDNGAGNTEIRFARLDSSGNRIGAEVRVTNDPGSSVTPVLRWNGLDYGVAWIDGRVGEVPYFTRVSCCDEMDQDGVNECHDCDDGNPAVFPGAEQVCGDGFNNDCNDPGWPGLAGTNEADDDGDGSTECEGDCDDSEPSVYSGAPQICDGINNVCGDPSWPAVPADEADADGDGYRLCSGECDDADPDIHPDAVEINDGKDNQCPPDPGYGVADELSGAMTFGNPTDPGEICWPAQEGASAYEVARSLNPAFLSTCEVQGTTSSCWIDPDIPDLEQIFYYLVRPTSPYLGSWGPIAPDVERVGLCGAETDCGDGVDNDGDGWIDCDDPGCSRAPGCAAYTFTFVDTLEDDVAPAALADFFALNPVSPTDYLFFSISGTGLTGFAWCAERADFYRSSYLAMALTGGSVMSGSWNRWTLQEGDSWTGPDTTGYPNLFGADCGDDFAFCPEFGLADRSGGVLPGQSNECEVLDLSIGCGPGDWILTLKVAASRFLACGF